MIKIPSALAEFSTSMNYHWYILINFAPKLSTMSSTEERLVESLMDWLDYISYLNSFKMCIHCRQVSSLEDTMDLSLFPLQEL